MKKRFKFELEYTAINGRCAPKLKGYDDMELACCIRLIMILTTQVYNYAKRSCIYAQRIVRVIIGMTYTCKHTRFLPAKRGTDHQYMKNRYPQTSTSNSREG